LSAASTPGHSNPTVDKGKKVTTTNGASHKQTAAKENKKFSSVTFAYSDATGGGITDPNNYTSGTPSCSGTTVLCSIQFDTDTYPLVGGKPSSTLLSKVQADFHTGTHQYTQDGITFTLKN